MFGESVLALFEAFVFGIFGEGFGESVDFVFETASFAEDLGFPDFVLQCQFIDRGADLFFDGGVGFSEEEFDGGFVHAPHVGVVLEAFVLGEAEGAALAIDVGADAPDSGSGKGGAFVLSAEELCVVDVVAVFGSGAQEFDGVSGVGEVGV